MKPGKSRTSTGVLPSDAARSTIGARGGVAGGDPADHLDQHHHRHRIHEVHPDHAFGLRGRRAERCDRHRAGVGGQDRVGRRVLVEPPEQIDFGVEILGRRFDRERDVEIVEVRARIDVLEHAAALLGRHPAFLHVAFEPFGDAVDAARDARLVDVVEQHLVPVHREHLSDAGAHLAGADDHHAHRAALSRPARAARRLDRRRCRSPRCRGRRRGGAAAARPSRRCAHPRRRADDRSRPRRPER